MNKLTYRSIEQIDAVLDHLAKLASRHNLKPEISFPRDPLPAAGETDAVVYDIDYLGLDFWGRRELVQTLASTPTSIPTAVHGYGLDDDEIEALRRNGIVALPKLNDALFAELAAMILGTSGSAVA